jgi:hypothetical protein
VPPAKHRQQQERQTLTHKVQVTPGKTVTGAAAVSSQPGSANSGEGMHHKKRRSSSLRERVRALHCYKQQQQFAMHGICIMYTRRGMIVNTQHAVKLTTCLPARLQSKAICLQHNTPVTILHSNAMSQACTQCSVASRYNNCRNCSQGQWQYIILRGQN